jgi:heme-degrading monooxygenase HmoA
MEIHPYQISSFVGRPAKMLRVAPKMPGFFETNVFRARGEPSTYFVLSEWESHEAMRSFLMQERRIPRSAS